MKARLISCVLALVPAIAPPAAADPDPQQPAAIVVIPVECAPFWEVPGGDTSPAAWDQVLSFAACAQDASVGEVDDPALLPGLVDELIARLTPVMPFYLAAIEHGPPRIQLRATYQVGMAYVGVMVRARSSIAASPRTAELHQRLEPLLEHPARVALLAFAIVARVAAAEPQVTTDPVIDTMVRSARAQTTWLRRDWTPEPAPERLVSSPP